MDRCRVLFCIAWVFIQVDGTYDIQAHTNANEIENQWIILEESVMRDVLELKESLNKIVGDINTAFGEYRAFTEGSVRDLNLHIESDMRKSDETLEKNTMALEEYTKTKVREMNKTLLENLQTLSETMAQERSSIVDWANQRSSFHEDILKTDVALCAYDDIQNSRGVVNYNGRHSGYINDQKSWRVFNETCNQESCAREVLNRQTGRFTVPKNADGLYLFTFSITMDTWDFIEGNTWDYYCFRKNGHEVIGTGLYGNVGSNEDSDKVPGSRTILLELNSGDVIDVYQRQEKNIPDRQASFCGSLIHLKKVIQTLSLTHVDFVLLSFCRLLRVLEVGRQRAAMICSPRSRQVLSQTMFLLILKLLRMLQTHMAHSLTKQRMTLQPAEHRFSRTGWQNGNSSLTMKPPL